MRIDVLNTMVVLVLRYRFSVKSYSTKNCRMSALPVRRIFYLLATQTPLNLDLEAPNLHRAEKLVGFHLPTKLGVSRCPRGQSPGGGVVSAPPLSSPVRVMEKGLAGRV